MAALATAVTACSAPGSGGGQDGGTSAGSVVIGVASEPDTLSALVAAVEDYRAATGAAPLAVGHDRTLLGRWCDRTVHWQSLA